MTRKDFKALALLRLGEAKALLDAAHFAGAYYLHGYVIECGLKACIARKTKRYDFPPDRKTVEKVYSHDFKALVVVADLDEKLDAMCESDQTFEDFWSAVCGWSEASRYAQVDEGKSRKLFLAITDRKHGVLRWIRGYW